VSAGAIPDELRMRIDADMARVPAMPLGEAVGFLANYTGSIYPLMLRCGATVAEVRAYADAALERARAAGTERGLVAPSPR
jgi:hypothetical protein